MSEQTNRDKLDMVLEEYMVSVPEPNHSTLVEWIQRYPQYAEELTAYTVAYLTTPFDEPVEDIVDEPTLQRDLEVVRDILGRSRQQGALTSIREAGVAAGLTTLAAIAQRTDLTPVLVRKLDLRLIPVASLPTELITRLSQALHVGAEALRQYFQGPAILPQTGSFRSQQPPAVTELEDFFEAVRKDPSLTDEQRRYWLSLKP